jgi:hypothetical protein
VFLSWHSFSFYASLVNSIKTKNMKKNIFLVLVTAFIAGGIVYGINKLNASNEPITEEEQNIVKAAEIPDLTGWPEASQKAAHEMINRYGNPSESTSDMLIWKDNGSWLRTIVHKKAIDHYFPMAHKDVLEQSVYFQVPLHSFSDLALYDGSITASRTNGIISVRCSGEEMNMLALNLAYDVIHGEKSTDQARVECGKQLVELLAGNKPEYTQKLKFSNDNSAPDPDKPVRSAEVSASNEEAEK